MQFARFESMTKPKIVSLFTGAGGMDYGFEAAGFETAVAVEMNRDCCATLRANRRWPVIEGDIMGVTTAEILSTAGLKPREADLLIGGPPCQPFSKAGYWARGDALRLEDPRANTLSAYLRILEEARPKAFVLENVEGLAYEGKDEGLKLLLDAIARINQRAKTKYRPKVQIVNAAEHGVPQFRNRVIIVGSRDGTELRFPAPSYTDEPNLAVPNRYRTAWDAIGDLVPEPDEDLALRGKWAELLPSIPEGRNYLFHTDRDQGEPLFGWRRRYWSFLLKLSKRLPSWTIQAQPGPAIGPFHWNNRRLSHRELCRLQTLPDDVRIVGSRVSIQRQVGNAVPSLLTEVLGREIRSQFFDSPVRGPLRLLPPDRSPAPEAERPTPVPFRYKRLAGNHSPHPGTGRGTQASVRAAASV